MLWINKPEYAYDEARILDHIIRILSEKKIISEKEEREGCNL